MGCTIGWIRTKEGYILFKNRDLNITNPIFSNFIRKSDSYVSFEDRRFKQGLWFAINNYGIGMACADGPYKDCPSGFMGEDFKKKLNKAVFLRITKDKITSADEATIVYKDIFYKYQVGGSLTVLICDRRKANVLELTSEKANVTTYHDSVFRTNHFLNMREYNKYSPALERSKVRLNKTAEFAESVRKAEDVLAMLKSHSRNDRESICRHGKSITMGSVSAELKNKGIDIFYFLNRWPCQAKEYKKEVITW
ncbi:MAG: hypothetical protein JSW73_02915 [Candidatus Woesearchaeota archaeon]|nr:MAG: hypothetical protein JSW73_02915 [Candidatus Woesearchaeota archaeon]